MPKWKRDTLLRLTSCTLLIATAGYTLAQTARVISGDLVEGENIHRDNVVASITKPSHQPITRKQVESWALFGTYQASPEEAGAPIPRSDLNVKISGIVGDPKTGVGWAILSIDNGEEKLYATDSKIKNSIIIKKIYKSQIVIERSGVLESIRLPEFDSIAKATPSGKATKVSYKEQTDKEEEKLAEDASMREKVLRYLALKPVQPGADSGYLVSEESDMLLKKYGLEPGDIIASANGYPLGTEAGDGAALQVYKRLGKAEVVVNRNGNQMTISYTP